MKAHTLDVLGKCTLPGLPQEDLEAVPKIYVDLATAGGIFITDVTPTVSGGNNIVGQKQYRDGTVPSDFLMEDGITNTASIRIHFLAEPKHALYEIAVIAKYNGGATEVPAQHIAQHANDMRLYEGYVDIVVDDQKLEETITLVSSTGAEASVHLDLLIGGPEVSTFTIGTLPNGQTEVKQGDVVPVSGTISNDATSIHVLNAGVSGDQRNLTLDPEDSAGPGLRSFSGSVVVSGRSGTLAAQVVGVNMLGTEGDPFSSNTIVLNQTSPSIGNIARSYPNGQQAIKGSESVDVTINISDADIYDYQVATGLSIDSPTSYAATKTITRSSEDIQYSVNSNVLTVTATKQSNGAVSTRSFAINVVNTAPSASLAFLGGHTRLRTDANGETYTLQITPNQPLLRAPDSLEAAANAGEFTGNWSKSGENYRHNFTVDDADLRGVHSWGNFTITGLSGIQASTITAGSTYEIGGLKSRIIVMPALAQYAPIGSSISDFSKVRAAYVGADELTRQTDLSQVVKGFTIVNSAGEYDPNGDHIFLNDGNFAGTNTTGTLQVEVEELA